MEKKVLVFGGKCIIKNSFHKYKQPTSINEADIIVLSSKESYNNKGALKYFIGYISNVGIIPLYITVLEMNPFVKYFDDNNNQMNF